MSLCVARFPALLLLKAETFEAFEPLLADVFNTLLLLLLPFATRAFEAFPAATMTVSLPVEVEVEVEPAAAFASTHRPVDVSTTVPVAIFSAHWVGSPVGFNAAQCVWSALHA